MGELGGGKGRTGSPLEHLYPGDSEERAESEYVCPGNLEGGKVLNTGDSMCAVLPCLALRRESLLP